jgi:simple sugar transport system permease protein
MVKNLFEQEITKENLSLKQKLVEFARRFNIQISIFGVLILIFSIFMIMNPKVFFSSTIYRAFMSSIPFSAIIALSLTFVIINGEIDLSFPSIMGFGSWVFASVYLATENIYLGLFISLIAGALMGIFNGLLVVKIGIPSLVATIATSFFWRGVLMVLASGKGIPLIEAKKTALFNILVGRITESRIPTQTIWTIIIAVFLWFLLNRHRFGLHVSYIGDNTESAKMMGVNVKKVKILVFVQLGIFAVFSGILASLEVVYLWPTLGEGYLIKAIAAVFIGGTLISGGIGSIFGTFIGAIIIGSLEAGIIAIGFTGFWTQLLYGLVMIIALSIYSYLRRRG